MTHWYNRLPYRVIDSYLTSKNFKASQISSSSGLRTSVDAFIQSSLNTIDIFLGRKQFEHQIWIAIISNPKNQRKESSAQCVHWPEKIKWFQFKNIIFDHSLNSSLFDVVVDGCLQALFLWKYSFIFGVFFSDFKIKARSKSMYRVLATLSKLKLGWRLDRKMFSM